METTTRNATLPELYDMLLNQNGRKLDMVVPATQMWADRANIVVSGTDPIITADGVTKADGTYRPTTVFDEGIAAKLGVPLAYVRRLRDERPDLYDANVNGWLYGNPALGDDGPGADPRSFMLRAFKADTDGGEGIARALLSNSYAITDHLDVLAATLDGVRQAGQEVRVETADLTDRRMVLHLVAPEVRAYATELLRGYRNPFGDDELARWRSIADREGMGYGGEEPIVFAGLRISNSETGGGAFSIVPELKIKVCRNGLVITKDAVRAVHSGGKLEDGVVQWSQTTHEANLALITSRATDAVRTFLDADYMTKTIAKLEAKAGQPVETVEQVVEVTKPLSFTQEQMDSVLGHFIRGGQTTLGGVVNAITSASQLVDDGDTAYDMDRKASQLLGV